MLAGGKHLFAILSDILDMARIDAGKTKLAESEFEIADAVRSVVRISADDLRGTGKTIAFVDGGCDATVLADERFIRKIAQNLISNAIKYTGADGSIVVSVQRSADGGVDLLVTDNGVGIAPEKFELIMQRFGQVEDVFARSKGGIGLGLPLVQALSAMHGGTFTLNSEVGRGTRAYFHLPASRVVVRAAVMGSAAR
jgi:signal transduction histidine kinase